MIHKIFISFVIAGLLLGVPSSGFAQFVKSDCIVMPGNQVKEKFSVDYNGEKIYFCCKACVKGFKRNPGKYLKNLKNQNSH